MNKFFNQLTGLAVRVVCGPDQAELQARREKELADRAILERVDSKELISAYRSIKQIGIARFTGRQANPGLAFERQAALLATEALCHPEFLDGPVQRLRQTLGIARAY